MSELKEIGMDIDEDNEEGLVEMKTMRGRLLLRLCDTLHSAAWRGDLQTVRARLSGYPTIAGDLNENGYSALHLASARGHLDIVRELLLVDSNLCLVKDKFGMTPLDTAVKNGRLNVVGELLSGCSESLTQLTGRSEIPLHIAVLHNQVKVVQLLVNWLRQTNNIDFINSKDRSGNTVLHLATSRKQLPILELLLACNSQNRVVVRVNCKNNDGLTAWDLHYQPPYNEVSREVCHMLQEAGAGPSHIGTRLLRQWSLETRSLLLVVLVMIAGAAFTTTCNPPSVFFREKPVESATTFHIRDTLFRPNRLPAIFYFMMFNIAGFSASMVAIVALMWSLPLRALLLFVVAMTFFVYVLSVNEAMPRFFVTIGSFTISSSRFVWLSALSLIFLGVLVSILVKLFRCICTKGRNAEFDEDMDK